MNNNLKRCIKACEKQRKDLPQNVALVEPVMQILKRNDRVGISAKFSKKASILSTISENKLLGVLGRFRNHWLICTMLNRIFFLQ